MRVSTPTARQLSAVIVCVLGMACAVQAGLPEGLVAYYKLDATAGLTAMDEIGAHDGTLTGALAWVEGINGNALEFVGGNGSPFVDLGAWQTDGPDGLSYCLWTNWAGTNGSYQGFLSQRDGTMYWWTEISPDSSNIRIKSNTSPQSVLELPTGTMVENEWMHLAFSHDAGTSRSQAPGNTPPQASALPTSTASSKPMLLGAFPTATSAI